MWYKPSGQPFADCVPGSVDIQGFLSAEAASFHDQRPTYALHFA